MTQSRTDIFWELFQLAAIRVTRKQRRVPNEIQLLDLSDPRRLCTSRSLFVLCKAAQGGPRIQTALNFTVDGGAPSNPKNPIALIILVEEAQRTTSAFKVHDDRANAHMSRDFN